VLHNSNASLCLLITVFYWGLVWPTIDEEFRYSELMDKIAGHGMVPAVVIIDLLLFSPIPKMKRQVSRARFDKFKSFLNKPFSFINWQMTK
jgi:hypothetical protein